MPRVKKVPLRMCVACQTMRSKREMIRVVRTPAGEVRVDPTGKVSGRGAYVCPAPACVERGIAKGRLGAALETPIPAEVGEAIRQMAQTMIVTMQGGRFGMA